MLAAVQGQQRGIVAVQRIYLNPLTGAKAAVACPKMTLGSMTGGAARLAAAAETLAVCEGVEDALTIHAATGLSVWATLGTAGLKSVWLPENVRRVVIAADNCEPGLKAAHAAAAVFREQGRRVSIVLPPLGCKDFNALFSGV
jgi:Toprim domain